MEEILKELSEHLPTAECSFFRGKKETSVPIEIQRTLTTPKETAILLWQDLDRIIDGADAVFTQLDEENMFHDDFFACDLREIEGETRVILKARVYKGK